MFTFVSLDKGEQWASAPFFRDVTEDANNCPGIMKTAWNLEREDLG